MKYKTVLVTGGAGFVGSNIAVFLKRRYPRATVIALDNLKRRGSELVLTRLRQEGVAFVHADVRIPEDLVLHARVDLLIECSAEPSVLAGCGDNPRYIIDTNLAGTVNCLEFARNTRADIIFMSTSRVYPYEKINAIKTRELPTRFDWKKNQKIQGWSNRGISEAFCLAGPRSLYGATKLASELLLVEYLKNYKLKGVINRFGVIAGPWQFGKIDQGVLAHWMLAHYFKRKLAYIGFGGRGKQVRDVLHIDDVCSLVDLQVKSLARISGQVYNVGGGAAGSLSLQEATRLCQEITGNRISMKRVASTRPADVVIYLTDNKKVSSQLGWQPHKAPSEVLSDIYNWVRQHERQLKDA
jgi:CDP-paratose 2-epimerase